jgi:hypothetical protein
MSDTKYIGMDVHAASISIAVLDEAGKLIMEATIATEASTIADFVGGLQGRLQVTFEEGIHAAWLYQMLLPSVAQVLVCDPRQLPRHKSERKSDRIDARQLAEWLRLGALKAVYHEGSGSGRQALGESVRSYLTLVSDTTRVMNRLKAIYRGRGIPARGTRVYAPAYRQVWLDQLREPGVRHRTELLYRQLDSLLPLRHEAKKSMIAESRKQAAAQKVLLSIPNPGPGARGDPDGRAANALPLSHQAETVELRRPGRGDALQRRLPTAARAAHALAPAGPDPGPEPESQPGAQGHLQGRGRHGRGAPRSLAGVLRPLSEARNGSRDRARDHGAQAGHFGSDPLEERRTFSR